MKSNAWGPALHFQISFYSKSRKNVDVCRADGSIKKSNNFISLKPFQWARRRAA